MVFRKLLCLTLLFLSFMYRMVFLFPNLPIELSFLIEDFNLEYYKQIHKAKFANVLNEYKKTNQLKKTQEFVLTGHHYHLISKPCLDTYRSHKYDWHYCMFTEKISPVVKVLNLNVSKLELLLAEHALSCLFCLRDLNEQKNDFVAALMNNNLKTRQIQHNFVRTKAILK